MSLTADCITVIIQNLWINCEDFNLEVIILADLCCCICRDDVVSYFWFFALRNWKSSFKLNSKNQVVYSAWCHLLILQSCINPLIFSLSFRFLRSRPMTANSWPNQMPSRTTCRTLSCAALAISRRPKFCNGSALLTVKLDLLHLHGSSQSSASCNSTKTPTNAQSKTSTPPWQRFKLAWSTIPS